MDNYLGFKEVVWPLTFTKDAIYDANGMFVRYRCWLAPIKKVKEERMNITEDEYKALGTMDKIDYLQKKLDAQVAYANELELQMADLEADLLTASTRDTAQLELIGKLEAENKRLRDIIKYATKLEDIKSHQLGNLSKDTNEKYLSSLLG